MGFLKNEGVSGFTTAELAVLLLVLAVFLAGTVYLVADGVRSLEDRDSDIKKDSAEELLERIETTVSDARQVNLDPVGLKDAAGGNEIPRGELDVLVDVDGDSSTGSFSVDGVGGLERVRISGGHGPTVYIFESRSSKPVSRVLSSSALTVGYEYLIDRDADSAGIAVSGVRIKAVGGSRRYSRYSAFTYAPVPGRSGGVR